MKYLLPYECYKDNDGTIEYVRKELGATYIGCYAKVWFDTDEKRWYHTFEYNKSWITPKKAMAILDAQLINMGFVLLTKEQAEKLKVLI